MHNPLSIVGYYFRHHITPRATGFLAGLFVGVVSGVAGALYSAHVQAKRERSDWLGAVRVAREEVRRLEEECSRIHLFGDVVTNSLDSIHLQGLVSAHARLDSLTKAVREKMSPLAASAPDLFRFARSVLDDDPLLQVVNQGSRIIQPGAPFRCQVYGGDVYCGVAQPFMLIASGYLQAGIRLRCSQLEKLGTQLESVGYESSRSGAG